VNFLLCQVVYNATNATVCQLAKSWAVERIDFFRVNSLSTAYTADKDEWETSRTPSQLKAGSLCLVSDDSSYTTGIDLRLYCDIGNKEVR
jgi:hypothetical protein